MTRVMNSQQARVLRSRIIILRYKILTLSSFWCSQGLLHVPKAEDEAGTSVDWHPVKDADDDVLDPASQAGSIAAMKERLKKIREEAHLPPG